MAKPSNGSTGSGGKGGKDWGGGGSTRNLPPSVEDNQTLYFNEDGTSSTNQYVIATDPEGGRLTYFLVDDYNGLFSIDSATGEVRINDDGSLDYDQGVTSYDLLVSVQDDAKKAATTTTSVKVELLDINDNAPEFSPEQTTYFTVEENRVNVLIGTVSATDLDASAEHNTLTYSLSGAYSDYFEIDQNGTLTLVKALDYEAVNTLDLTVIASDGELVSQQLITIDVSDIDETNFYPIEVSEQGRFIGAENGWEGGFNQFSPYSIAIADNDNPDSCYVFDLSVTNIPGTVAFESYVNGDLYSAGGASFHIGLYDESAFYTFNLYGSITYQGIDAEGKSLFDISVDSVTGFDAYATHLYDGAGLNADPWYSHDTGSFSESYWNPVDFGLNLNWTISQYDNGSLVESAEFLSTLDILDTDSEGLEDLLVFSNDEFIGASKPDVPPEPIHVSNGEVLTFEFFDPDASVVVLENVLDIQPDLDLVGDAPLVDLGNNQYQVTADAGEYNMMMNMSHEGIMETFQVSLIVDA